MEQTERIRKRLRNIYIKCWLIVILIGIALIKLSFPSTNKEINVSLESISVCGTLLGIWGVYTYYKKQIKNLLSRTNKNKYAENYKRLFITCILILFGILLIDIFAFSILRTISGMFAILMTSVAILLSYPGKYRVTSDLENNDINNEK
ncbi:MAG: hypothetical protein LUG18_03820 [Candidatus Azobacteroides sp.]|nr:hypothetical protein [Candidatus Azobacteroides sp.]